MDNAGELSIHAGSIPRTTRLTMFIGFLMSMSYAWPTRLLASLAIRTHTAYRHADRPVLPDGDHHRRAAEEVVAHDKAGRVDIFLRPGDEQRKVRTSFRHWSHA